jgi:MOSC domain-containing protein YiiM
MREELGSVVEIFSATVGSSGLPRPVVNSLELIEGYGIKDDKFADYDLDKSVMIVGQNSYNIAKKNGIDLLYGSYGENILLSFDPHTLDIGTLLNIGNTTIEITEKCTICDHLSVFSPKLPRLIKKYRGIYCKILKGGQVITKLQVTI